MTDEWSGTHGPLVDPSTVPDWLAGLVEGTAGLDAAIFRRLRPPAGRVTRKAAVLMLLGEDRAGPDVLLLRRAATLGAHAGQVAFPGGGVEPGDHGPVDTALREAAEEVGVLADGVRPVALLPRTLVPVSGFEVAPVLAHWREPCAVRPVDPAETAAVARVPIAHLVDPANRFQVTGPSGFVSPAYLVPGMLVWGFTAALLSVLLAVGGWERPWNTDDVRELDEAWRSAEELGADSGSTSAGRGSVGSADGTLPPASAEVEAR